MILATVASLSGSSFVTFCGANCFLICKTKDLVRQEEYKARIRKMRIAEELDADDYRIEKQECEQRIIKLEENLATMLQAADLQPQLENAFSLLSNIDEAYGTAGIDWRRDFIGSMFPEKLEFTGSGFRTARVNEVAQLIFNLGAAFSESDANKKAALLPLGLVS